MAMGLHSSHSSTMHLFIYEVAKEAIGCESNDIVMEEANLPIKDELSKRIHPTSLMSILNLEIIDYGFNFDTPRAIKG
jgi:hypothetical protein